MKQALIGRGWHFPPRLSPQSTIELTTAENEIQQAIMIILNTVPGERVMRPTFGSRLHELVFAPINHETAAQAVRFVQEALGMWEPRIEIHEINVDIQASYPEGHGFLPIEIHYTIKATRDKRSLVYPFYLLPQE